MKLTVLKLISSATTALCLSTVNANSSPFTLFGDALLRYENEHSHLNIPDRERLRVVAHLGAKYRLNKDWQLMGD